MDFLPSSKYEREVIDWVTTAVQEGQAFLKSQYGYDQIDKTIQYIQGDQRQRPKSDDLSNYASNRLGKVTTDIVAALTDIKPLFSFRTGNKSFEAQGKILNDLTRAWWLNNFIDLKLGGGIQLALPAGCAYLHLIWNQDLQGGHGDLDVVPLDARDVIPIRPMNSISVQDCTGVVIVSSQTTNYLESKYPHLRGRIKADGGPASYTPRSTAFGRMMNRVMSPVHKSLQPNAGRQQARIPMKIVYTCYIKDDSVHKGSEMLEVGYGRDRDGNKVAYSWSYDVVPGDLIYPRGRVIVCSDDMVFYDGPNIYWHGRFPLVKLYTDLSFVYQDSWFSKSVIADLVSHQDLINEMINGIADAVKQALQPGAVADSRAVPLAVLEKLNTRKPGFKLLHNPTTGPGVQWSEARQLPAYLFDFLQFIIHEVEYLSGSQDLSNLAKVKQIPAVESVEAIMQAMTPATRMRGRLMESALRELAELAKFGFFQFYDAPRRIAMLGPDGISMEDFDFDPGSLVPDPINYPEYAGMPRNTRAIKHSHNFTFFVTPNSMLEVALVTKKMLYLQLRRSGDLDWETFMEAMEVPNLPEVMKRLGSEIDQKIAMAQAAQATPQGRPPSAQTGPHMEVKDGGTRPTVAES